MEEVGRHQGALEGEGAEAPRLVEVGEAPQQGEEVRRMEEGGLGEGAPGPSGAGGPRRVVEQVEGAPRPAVEKALLL